MSPDKREKLALYYESLAAAEKHEPFRYMAKLIRANDQRAIELAEWMLSDWSFGGEVPEPFN